MLRTFFAIPVIAVFAVSASPQDDAKYQEWMRSIQPTMRAIRTAPDNAAAKADAQKLADTFNNVAEFWKAHHADDAVQLSEKARDAAKAIADGSGDKAANVQAIQSTCAPCHSAHREGTPPNFKIKY